MAIKPTTQDAFYNHMQVIITYKDGRTETGEDYCAYKDGTFDLTDENGNEHSSEKQLEKAGIVKIECFGEVAEYFKWEKK